MKTIKNLKEDDALYGFCLNDFSLEIYNVLGIFTDDHIFETSTPRIFYTPILCGEEERNNIDENGYSDAYIMFPEGVDIDKAILCKYNEDAWWIYTTNFEAIRKYVDEYAGVEAMHNINFLKIISEFKLYLDIWTQKLEKNSYYVNRD